MNKIVELAFLRNRLATRRFDEKDKELMEQIKKNIFTSTTPFKELAINAFSNCEQDIENADFDSATQEMQLIHNFTFDNFKAWDADHFYRIELLSYIELARNTERIKKLITLLAGLEKH